MKNFLQQLVTACLTYLARRRLSKSNPTVITVAGSIGKTTTKEAIAHLLASTLSVQKTEGNYNSEIGLPLTILGQRAGSGAVSWLKVLWRSLIASFRPLKGKIFVAELGEEKAGDIAHLMDFLKPQISVITRVAKVHLKSDQFLDEQAIRAELETAVSDLPNDAIAVLNADDPLVNQMKTRAAIIRYGEKEEADIRLLKKNITTTGLAFTVSYQKQEYSFTSPVLGAFLVYAFLPAIAISLYFKVPVEKIQQALQSFQLPKGRFNRIEGIKGSTIIDSSYNASPAAVMESLEDVSKMSGGRKIAVLGNMNELGQYSENEHAKVGQYAASRCDLLITVGEDTKFLAAAARQANPSLQVQEFHDFVAAGSSLKEQIQGGDIILAKGSQNNVFLEELVKEIMLHPEEAKNLLVRQDEEWMRKKEKYVQSLKKV